MNKYKLIALFGASGAGKDTVQNWMVSNIPDSHKLISYTTRPPRDNEIDNKDYHFISIETFTHMKLNNMFLETTYFNNWYYGTSSESLKEGQINIGVFNPEGVKNIINNFTNIHVYPLQIWANDKVRLIRSLIREKDPDCLEICRRFIADHKDFNNIDFQYLTYDNSDFNNDYTKLDINAIIKYFGQN